LIVYLLFHDVYASNPRESGFASPAADRYKMTIPQFDRELASLVMAGPRALPFALTFDDGGSSFYTVIADRLEALGWRGHCFVVTDCIGQPGFLTRGQIRELAARGHSIGSHTASHPMRINSCEPGHIEREWRTSVAVLQDILGAPVETASVPGGFYGPAVAYAAAVAGISTLFTSEPVRTSALLGACQVHGRFTLRGNCNPGLARRLVSARPWSRWGMWAQWNAKAAVKPMLGPRYVRVADWLLSRKAALH
jgi:peptidoglycan/xylan/chitin deacetylase (PgdA/CDA1 family)